MKANEDFMYLEEKILIWEALREKVYNELGENERESLIYEFADCFSASASYDFINGTMELLNTEASDMEDMLDDMKFYKCSTWVDLSNTVIDKYINIMSKYLLKG